MSSPNNPLPELQVEPSGPLPAAPLLPLINPGAENPPWTGLDVFVIVLVLLAALFVSTAASFWFALHSRHFAGVSAAELAKNPGSLVIVPAMTLSYAALVAFMYVLVTRVRHRPFWQAVSWRWPGGKGWLCLLGGGMLALTLGLLAKLLPVPKSLPMDRFFGDRQSAYLMALFGVAVAPLAEELLFRGFLYPALDRWLETLFMLPPRLLRASIWVFLVAGWGYLEHRLPLPWSVLLAALAFLVTAAMLLMRSLGVGRKPAHLVLLPGTSFFVWGLLARSLSDHAFKITSLGLLIMVLVLAGMGLARPLAAALAGRLGRLLAILLTAAGFASVHSDQLARAWGPLLIIFLVGLTLTLTRALTRSLAPGFLIHVGYNLTLFGLLYLGTDHFRHLERMTQ